VEANICYRVSAWFIAGCEFNGLRGGAIRRIAARRAKERWDEWGGRLYQPTWLACGEWTGALARTSVGPSPRLMALCASVRPLSRREAEQWNERAIVSVDFAGRRGRAARGHLRGVGWAGVGVNGAMDRDAVFEAIHATKRSGVYCRFNDLCRAAVAIAWRRGGSGRCHLSTLAILSRV